MQTTNSANVIILFEDTHSVLFWSALHFFFKTIFIVFGVLSIQVTHVNYVSVYVSMFDTSSVCSCILQKHVTMFAPCNYCRVEVPHSSGGFWLWESFGPSDNVQGGCHSQSTQGLCVATECVFSLLLLFLSQNPLAALLMHLRCGNKWTIYAKSRWPHRKSRSPVCHQMLN